MNLNEELYALGDLLDCPVDQDLFEETEDTKTYRFLVFTYEDEQPELCGDNKVEIENSLVMISYYVPKDGYNYFDDKDKIKRYLWEHDYIIRDLNIFSDGTDKKGDVILRRLLFSVEKAG